MRPRRVTLLLAATLALPGCSVTTSSTGTPTTSAGGPSPSPGTAVPPSAGPGLPTAAASSRASAAAPVRIPLSGAAPDAIAIDGETAWVLTGEGGRLIEVDLAAGREVDATEVGFGATHLAFPASGTAAVGRFDDSGTNGFCVLVGLAGHEVRSVPTAALGGLTTDGSGGVWALEKAGRLLRIDVATGQVADSTTVVVGENVHTEIQWGAGSVWLGSDGLPVVRIDAADLAKRTTIEVETGIPFLFEGGLLWGAGPTALWAIDPATNEIVRRLPLVRVSEILGLDVDGDEAWLAVRRPGAQGAVLAIDLASGEVVQEEAVSLPAAVRLDHERAWVASYLTNDLLGFQR